MLFALASVHQRLVQLQSDPATMPIEDSLAEWDQRAAPFRCVATIRIPRQDMPEQTQRPDHRPLGSINRARKVIYNALSEFRQGTNAVPRAEPVSMPSMP